VHTRRPVAIVVREPLTYLDETGVWFVAGAHGENLDLPYISGLAGLSLETPLAQSALIGVPPLLTLSRLWAEPLSEVHWDRYRGYTVFLMRRRVTIRLGWETLPEKFVQIGTVLTHWPVDGPAALFDARFANQVVVQPEAEKGSVEPLNPIRPL
jgi:hypothetical protein